MLNKNGARFWILCLVVAAGLLLIALYCSSGSTESGLITRTSILLPEDSPYRAYADELLSLWISPEEYAQGNQESKSIYSEMYAFRFDQNLLRDASDLGYHNRNGRALILSPDKQSILLMEDMGEYFWTIKIFDVKERAITSLVSIREMEPGSDPAFIYAWSKDSKAVFVCGYGDIATVNADAHFPLIYILGEDQLYHLKPWSDLIRNKLPHGVVRGDSNLGN